MKITNAKIKMYYANRNKFNFPSSNENVNKARGWPSLEEANFIGQVHHSKFGVLDDKINLKDCKEYTPHI